MLVVCLALTYVCHVCSIDVCASRIALTFARHESADVCSSCIVLTNSLFRRICLLCLCFRWWLSCSRLDHRIEFTEWTKEDSYYNFFVIDVCEICVTEISDC